MPELPDLTVYAEALERRVVGRRVEAIRLFTPFVLRTVEPPISAAVGKRALALERIGKRLAIVLEDELALVIHLMIAGRFRWRAPGEKALGRTPGANAPGRTGLAAFDFESGTLLLTEAGTKRRASLMLVQGRSARRALDPGGLEVLTADLAAFAAALTRESHTLKRALTDPHLFSGIGNAYSDEILHRARLSPLALTGRLDSAQIERLHAATRAVLTEWTDRLRAEAGDGFPEKVTAFREGMAVHGRYGRPCPDCGAPVQRIAYADNECNYCARCQTGGKLLSDRALARLMHDDWPRTIDELESRKRPS